MVRGGLTFSQKDGDCWKIGFDCAHCDDLVPFINSVINLSFGNNSNQYRNIDYVKNELNKLVIQLEAQKI